MFLVDSHCHLDILDYQSIHKNIDDVLEKASSCNVEFFLTVSTTLSGYRAMRKLVGKRNNVAFSCGVHPLNQDEIYKVEELRLLAAEEGVIAIGETGLDYHKKDHKKEIKFFQQESFRNHIRVGCELNKPIIVHTREAFFDTLAILKEEKITNSGNILHCFTGNKEIASKFLDLGFYISFSGIITFRNANHLHDVVRYIPIDRILLETDSPYLTPAPYRGRENQPAMVKVIAGFVSELKGLKITELSQATTENFFNLFHIDFIN